ncbi:phosphotransferase [Streptomyces sp. NPDC050703]|uniref:phosphotransferase n=1 Tax=Streptomyces sp. NPDC050703 TaxID=3157218 RepID=UPI003445ED2A
MPRALARFRVRHPGVTLTHEEGRTPALLSRLAEGGLDLAVVSTTGGALPDGVHDLHHLLDETLYVALPAGHPLAAEPELRLPRPAAEDWISGSPHIEGSLLRLALRHGFRPHVAHVVAEWTAKQGYVAAGLGIALVPQLAAESARPDITLVPLRDGAAPAREVYAATARGRAVTSAATAFLAALRHAAAGLDPCSPPARSPALQGETRPMAEQQMHADEAATDETLVRRLVAAQFPAWAGLPVRRVDTAGTANAMYRLGADMVVRLPRLASSAEDVEAELRWLPRLAAALPVAVPEPLGKGGPGEGYPFAWSVFRWLAGSTPEVGVPLAGPALFAEDVARFLTALREVDPAGAPAAYRSEPLARRDARTREVIARLRGTVDEGAATAVWDAALRAPAWGRAPVWTHGDLQPGNVLVDGGRLGAVIDFGCMGLGDPAVDLISAWYLMDAAARDAFRTALGTAADDAMWARGRGWALSIALDELDYYRRTNPRMARTARHVLGQLTRAA